MIVNPHATPAERCDQGAYGVHSFTDDVTCRCGQTYSGMLDAVARENGFPSWEAMKWDGWTQHTHEDGGACVGFTCRPCKVRMCRAHLDQHFAEKHGPDDER